MAKQIPSVTVSRLVAYLRVLTALEENGVDYVTSEELGAAARVSAHQVRKDLVHVRENQRQGRNGGASDRGHDHASGTRGRGYTVPILRRELSSILGLTRPWNVSIVGMGHLGKAIARYPYFESSNFALRCGFDVDPRKVDPTNELLPVYPMAEMPERARQLELDIALLTVPGEAAEDAARAIERAKIPGILNFAPTAIAVAPPGHVESVDFVAGLKRLAYYLNPEPAAEAEALTADD